MSASNLEQVRDYWERYADRLLERAEQIAPGNALEYLVTDHAAAYAVANARLEQMIGGCDLLELTYGVGLDTVRFAQAGARVTSVNLSERNARLTRLHVTACGQHAEVRVANPEALPFAPRSFDVVTARALLMYTPNPSAVVADVYRVVRPGGLVQATLSNRRSWYVLLGRVLRMNLVDAVEDPLNYRLYTPAEALNVWGRFVNLSISADRLPTVRSRRPGLASRLFNSFLVPAASALPRRWLEPFGYYLVVEARKPVVEPNSDPTEQFLHES